MPDTFEEISETFEFLDDWEDRYTATVIDIGQAIIRPRWMRRCARACNESGWMCVAGVDLCRGSTDGHVFHFQGDQRCDDCAGA